jgi:phage tail sheath gpL-like
VTPDPQAELAARLTALRMPAVDPEQVAALAAREFTATDPDAPVTATVSGAGQLLRLDVSVTATRGSERAELGARVVRTVNAALDEAVAARRALLSGADAQARLGDITQAFDRRMDSLLARLDEIDRSLPS